MKETTILFQGDSITDGLREKNKDRAWDLNHQMGHGYAFLVNARWGAQYPERHFAFINRGISGNRIADLYGRWQEDAVNLRPDVLSILVGINDVGFTMWEQSGSGPERFGRIYQLLLDEARAANPALLMVLMEPFVMPVGDRKDTYQDWLSLLRPLQEQTRLIAERNGAIFIPLQERFERLCQVREASYWVWDGIHPTVSGHQVIADAWMEAVGPALGLSPCPDR
ncbi:MAG: SGNH/GDSL hydrolase family protein [Eubacteriales bacterium]|nr:SGNH/GDSL hydrolase family protein [Eubacteriales bacterium]